MRVEGRDGGDGARGTRSMAGEAADTHLFTLIFSFFMDCEGCLVLALPAASESLTWPKSVNDNR